MSSWTTESSLSMVRWPAAIVFTRPSSASRRSVSVARSSSVASDACSCDDLHLVAQGANLVLGRALVLGAERQHNADDPGGEAEHDRGRAGVAAHAELAVERRDPGAQPLDPLLERLRGRRLRAGGRPRACVRPRQLAGFAGSGFWSPASIAARSYEGGDGLDDLAARRARASAPRPPRRRSLRPGCRRHSPPRETPARPSRSGCRCGSRRAPAARGRSSRRRR